jgi:hypothetical protein
MIRNLTYISSAKLIVDEHYVKLEKFIYFFGTIHWSAFCFKTQYPAACCAWVRRRRFTHSTILLPGITIDLMDA